MLRAGAPLTHERKVTKLVHGFDPSIRKCFRYVQRNTNATIIDILEKAKFEGDVYHQRKGKRRTSRAVAAVQEVDSSTEKEEQPSSRTSKGVFSEMTAGAPTTGDILADYHQEAAQVYEFSAAGRIKAKSFGNPGWRIPTRSNSEHIGYKRLVVVCERCYERSHDRGLPHGLGECPVVLPRDSAKVMLNFSCLALWEIGKVHLNLYLSCTSVLNDQSFSHTGYLHQALASIQISGATPQKDKTAVDPPHPAPGPHVAIQKPPAKTSLGRSGFKQAHSTPLRYRPNS